MIGKLLRAVTYAVLALACVLLLSAFLIEIQVYTVPIWPGHEMDIGTDNTRQIRLAMILLAIAVCLFISLRLRR